MRSNDGSRTGGEILVDQLVAHGVRHAFCVPGESYLAALDAFHDRDIALTVCRQEGGAAMMAEAVGKATGRPGICFVTRGPGASNASPGIHIAMQDSTPLIVFVGQVARDMREREAFQELDYRAVFGTMAKWATEIDDPARIPEIVSRAFHTATNGRPGPVVIALPEDMLTERVRSQDAPSFEPIETWPGLTDMARLQKMLWAAKRPMMILGGSRWSQKACGRDARFAERFDIPVCTTFRRGHLFDATASDVTRGDLGIGTNPKIARARQGLRPGGRWSAAAWAKCRRQSYTLFDIPAPQIRPSCMCIRTPKNSAASIARLCASMRRRRLSPPRWKACSRRTTIAGARRRRSRHADYMAWTEKPTERRAPSISARSWCGCAASFRPTRMLCNGAGNFSGWMHRFYRLRRFGSIIASDFRLDGIWRAGRGRR